MGILQQQSREILTQQGRPGWAVVSRCPNRDNPLVRTTVCAGRIGRLGPSCGLVAAGLVHSVVTLSTSLTFGLSSSRSTASFEVDCSSSFASPELGDASTTGAGLDTDTMLFALEFCADDTSRLGDALTEKIC